MTDTRPTFALDIALHLDAPDVLAAGKLCLEFANTNNWHAAEHPVESLYSYSQIVDWAASVGIRTPEAAHDLKSHAANHPALAEQVYEWAIELREAIYRIFVAIAEQQPVAPTDLALLNEALPHAFTLPEVMQSGVNQSQANHNTNAFAIRWRGDESGLDGILWPIVRSAVRLLTDGEHNRIGQCADDRGCGYLFYDTSRNRSRRWCDMNSCGNRAKSQRHYARHRNPSTSRKQATPST
jgi:predicted RNA-binding Zn ribbon-like protein